ncbi:uncharacterized protein LOC111946955 [Oryzias latipes]
MDGMISDITTSPKSISGPVSSVVISVQRLILTADYQPTPRRRGRAQILLRKANDGLDAMLFLITSAGTTFYGEDHRSTSSANREVLTELTFDRTKWLRETVSPERKPPFGFTSTSKTRSWNTRLVSTGRTDSNKPSFLFLKTYESPSVKSISCVKLEKGHEELL